MDLLIVGAGSMGRWFGRTLRDHVETLAFADVDPETAEDAASAVGGRAVPVEGDDRFDVVCLAVPIPAVTEAAVTHAARAREAVCDLTGVMGPAVAALRDHAPDRERVSLHPLFAPERAPGTVAVVPDASGAATDRIRRALVEAGNDVVETTPEEHDRAMETVQAKAHAAVLAFALAAEDVPEAFATPVSEGLTDLVGMVTGGDPSVYADVQEAFSGAEEVATAAERVADADREGFEALYRRASEDHAE